jgi:hypothetical protein
MGGDEFCLLAPLERARLIADSLSEEGWGSR